MLLAIDISNTSVLLGVYENGALKAKSSLQACLDKHSDEYAVSITNILSLHGISCADITGAIIASVVPGLLGVVKQAVNAVCNVRILCVGPGVKTGLNIKIDNPAQLGSDLVCCAVSVLHKYEAPSIIISFDTAVTFTAINKSKELMGCSILPGVKLSLDALISSTAQLPQIDLEQPVQNAIGTNSSDSICGGILFGTACMADGMINLYKESLGENCSVIATGDMARRFTSFCKSNIIYDENLILDGLWYIYNKNVKNK